MQAEVIQAEAVRETSLRKEGIGEASLEEQEGCQEAPGGGGAPRRCLTWGPAAALWGTASANVGRAQLASTTNPDGSPGAASTKAAFTDVVPRSMPRVTDRTAMAVGTRAASSWGQSASSRTLHPGPKSLVGASPDSPSATLNMAASHLPIGRDPRTPHGGPWL